MSFTRYLRSLHKTILLNPLPHEPRSTPKPNTIATLPTYLPTCNGLCCVRLPAGPSSVPTKDARRTAAPQPPLILPKASKSYEPSLLRRLKKPVFQTSLADQICALLPHHGCPKRAFKKYFKKSQKLAVIFTNPLERFPEDQLYHLSTALRCSSLENRVIYGPITISDSTVLE